MKQKRYLLFLLSLFAALGFAGCDINDHQVYAIDVENAICTCAEQDVVVEYSVHSDIMYSNIKFDISCSEPWLKFVDSSEFGELRFRVEENEGDTRSANITIAARGCVTTTITLLQYGTPPAEAAHTLMFYFFGTSLSRYFKTNLEDAAIAIETGILSNKSRVLFFRQESATSAYIGELCYSVEGGKCIEQRIMDIALDKTSIITPAKIGEHISLMADIAPAKRYGIIFAGHGQGWVTREIINKDGDIELFGVGGDPWLPAVGAEVTRAFGESNVQVNIAELAEGIHASGVELDYILFDACFMSNIESIYDLRTTANYIIASPCEIMGKGFPYHRTLPYLFVDYGDKSDYVGAARSYYEYYRDEYTSTSRCGSVAVYECADIEALAEATHNVMQTAKQEGDYDITTLQTYEGQRPHQFYDFGEWVGVVATDGDALERFNAAMKECVVATYTLDSFYSAYGVYGTYPINLDVYSGVTTSAPSEAYPNGWKTTNWYNEVIALEN